MKARWCCSLVLILEMEEFVTLMLTLIIILSFIISISYIINSLLSTQNFSCVHVSYTFIF